MNISIQGAPPRRFVGEPFGLRQVPERVVEGELRVFVGPKPIRFSGRNPRFIVESLGGAMGEGAPCAEPVEQELSMATEGPCELLERRNPGTHGQTCPIVQEPSSPRGRLVLPETLELLLQQVGANATKVDAEQIAKRCALCSSEICTILEKNPPCLRQHGLLSRLPEYGPRATGWHRRHPTEQLRGQKEAVEDLAARRSSL